MPLWYDEVHKEAIRFGLKVERTLFVGRSSFQKVSVVETSALGRALLIDDLWMTAEGDEKTYHEMIAHPALCVAPRIARVLVIGGGDGGTVREVLKHPEVEHVHLVEIDEMVVKACQEHLPTIGTAWDDPRLKLTIGDGVGFVREAEVEPYDVILVDGSDPTGPAVGLFDEVFYRGCERLLADQGVFVTQAESPLLLKDVHVDMLRAIEATFGNVHPYYGTVTIYPGGQWSWALATRGGIDPLSPRPERVERIAPEAFIYNADIHRGAFAVPSHVRRALAGA